MERVTIRKTSRNQRGSIFIWTAVIALPVLFFGLGLASDFTRIILADREATNVAASAALSGAYQFNPGAATVNASRGRAAAVETVCIAQHYGTMRNAEPAATGRTACSIGSKPVAVDFSLTGNKTVAVTVRYRVPNLVLLNYFNVGSQDMSVTKTATICNPTDTSGPTGGQCVRPTL